MSSWAEYLQELFGAYDPSIDTSSGSRFDRVVLQPLLRRIGEDALDADPVEVISAVIQASNPTAVVGPGSALHDLVIQLLATGHGPLAREIRLDRVAAAPLTNHASMRREELSQWLGGFLLSLDNGQAAGAVVRTWFRAPQAVVVTGLTAFTLGSETFYPSTPQTISAEAMALNRSGAKYYFDITVAAATAGRTTAAVDDAVAVVGIPGLDYARVLSISTEGTDAETSTEAVARAEESITQRNYVTPAGIRTCLPGLSEDIGNIVVVRTGDDEMHRDVVRGPATLGSIPGGVLGLSNGSLGSGDIVHIGGKTDVYLQLPWVRAAVDIDNVANVGLRRHYSAVGYTLPGVSHDAVYDDTARFNQLLREQDGWTPGPLDASGTGFYLRIAGNEFGIRDVGEQYLEVFTDANSTTDPVGYAPASPEAALDPYGVGIRTNLILNSPNGDVELAGGLVVPYDVVFRDFRGDPHSWAQARGFVADVQVGFLVAEDADGAVVDANGDPVAPQPGYAGPTESLTDADGVDVPKAEVYFIEDPQAVGTLQQGPNIAADNVARPILWVDAVEVLDPITDEVLEAIPHGAIIRAEVMETIAVGASGRVRLWFLGQPSAAVFRTPQAATALFYDGEPLLAEPLIAYSAAVPTGVTTGSWGSYYDFVDEDGVPNVALRIRVTGLTTTLPVVTTASAPVTIANIAGLRRAVRAGDRVVYWREPDFTDAVVLTIKTVNATSLVVEWPSGSFPPAASGWDDDEADFAIVPGIRAGASTAYGELSYAEFYFVNHTSNVLESDTELDWLLAAEDVADGVMPTALRSPARVEGWRLLADTPILSMSTWENPVLRLPWQVNDDTFLFDPPGYGTSVGAPRIRVTSRAPVLSPLQAAVLAEENRGASEDILVRHLLPAMVGVDINYTGADDAETMLEVLQHLVETTDPETGLQVSDINALFTDRGATYVQQPLTLRVITQDLEHALRLHLVTDTFTAGRLYQTYLDTSRTTLAEV